MGLNDSNDTKVGSFSHQCAWKYYISTVVTTDTEKPIRQITILTK
jgi:hypothetical protein